MWPKHVHRPRLVVVIQPVLPHVFERIGDSLARPSHQGDSGITAQSLLGARFQTGIFAQHIQVDFFHSAPGWACQKQAVQITGASLWIQAGHGGVTNDDAPDVKPRVQCMLTPVFFWDEVVSLFLSTGLGHPHMIVVTFVVTIGALLPGRRPYHAFGAVNPESPESPGPSVLKFSPLFLLLE
jgi:hypothetical protein